MSKNETVVLPDGTSVGVTRPNSIDDQTWASVKEYLQKNPNNAKTMQKAVQEMTENPMKQEQFREVWLRCCTVRLLTDIVCRCSRTIISFLQVMALAEHMKNDQSVPTKLQGLASDPQLASAFNEMKAGVCYSRVVHSVRRGHYRRECSKSSCATTVARTCLEACAVEATRVLCNVITLLQGMDAVMKYYNDENFLRLVSQKMGGVPKEMKAAMMNLHECVRLPPLAPQ